MPLATPSAALALAGEAEATLRRLEALPGAALVLRGQELRLDGRPAQVQRARDLIELLRPLWEGGERIEWVDIQAALTALDTGRGDQHRELGRQVLAVSRTGRQLRPRTAGQKRFVDAIDRHAANPALAPRFQGLDLPDLKARGVSFLVAASGGPDRAVLAGPAPQHAGMGFSAAELQAVVGDVAQALAEQGAGVAEVGEVVSLIRRLNRTPPPV
jgi:phosphate starvation-inducible PhoH-like protein